MGWEGAGGGDQTDGWRNPNPAANSGGPRSRRRGVTTAGPGPLSLTARQRRAPQPFGKAPRPGRPGTPPSSPQTRPSGRNQPAAPQPRRLSISNSGPLLPASQLAFWLAGSTGSPCNDWLISTRGILADNYGAGHSGVRSFCLRLGTGSVLRPQEGLATGRRKM